MELEIRDDRQCVATESGARKLRAAVIDLSLTDAVSYDERDTLWDMIHRLRDQTERYRADHPPVGAGRSTRQPLGPLAYLLIGQAIMAATILIALAFGVLPASVWALGSGVIAGYGAYRDGRRLRTSLWEIQP